MEKNLYKKEEIAQIIPIVVIGILIVVMLAALIVDGGSLLSNRRTAQAAADAGALAGAKQLCTGDTLANRTTARNTALQYVTANQGVFASEPTFSTVSINGHDVVGITVQANVTNDQPFFAGIFGADELKSSAEATAGCYHPSETVRLIPIAFYYQSPPVNAKNADCDDPNKPCNIVNYEFTDLMAKLQNTQITQQPLDDIYVIMNDIKVCEKDTSGAIVCADMAKNASGGNRAWIDLSVVADMSNLKKIFNEGVEKPLYLPAWLNGEPGNVSAMYQTKAYEDMPPIEGYESLPYRMVLVPVFDYYCDSGDPENDCPTLWTEGDSVDYINNSNQQSYRLVGLAPFVITCVTQSQAAETKIWASVPKKTGKNKTNKAQCPGYLYTDMTEKNAIEGYFVTGTPLDQYASGTGGVSAGLDIVSLTK